MLKLYYFPPYIEKNLDTNPYSSNFKEALSHYFDVIEKDYKHKGLARISFIQKAFLADVYVLNWVESIGKGIKNLPLFLASYLGVLIILIRRKKIIWMFHNIHPHSGENYYSRTIQSLLYNHSTAIVSHSKEAMTYAKSRAKCRVDYVCHPVTRFTHGKVANRNCDILIWGAILPYKGIAEFVSLPEIQASPLDIRIIGKCKDSDLEKKISSFCNEHISFENRFADIDELSELCKSSKFVLFPYLSESVSSSGALIDTVAMGGTPVGPCVGAFKDLEYEGVCFTYKDKASMLRLLQENITINDKARNLFIDNNSWEALGKRIFNIVNNENDN